MGSMQDLTVIEESSDFYIQSDPHGLFVEAWTAWHLPFMNLTASQSRYRACVLPSGGSRPLAEYARPTHRKKSRAISMSKTFYSTM